MKNSLKLSIIIGLCLSLLVGCGNLNGVPKDDFEAYFSEHKETNGGAFFHSFHHLKTQFPNTAQYVVLPYYDRINQFKTAHSEYSEYFVVDKEGLSFVRFSLDNYPDEKLNLQIFYTRGDRLLEGVDKEDTKTPHWVLLGNTSMKNTEITKSQFTLLSRFFDMDAEELFNECYEMVMQSKTSLEFDDILISVFEENGYILFSLRKELP